MAKNQVSSTSILKYQSGEWLEKPDLVPVEEPLEIRLGFGKDKSRQKKSVSITMRTPGHDFELAIGFLFTEGIIKAYDHIKEIRYCTSTEEAVNHQNIVILELQENVVFDWAQLERNFYTTSSCGICGKASIESIENAGCPILIPEKEMVAAETLLALPGILRQNQTSFQYTGGVHASAIFDTKGKFFMGREDVGRHNALDKLIGANLVKKEQTLSSCILLLSGRISFELVQKAAMASIPVIAAIGAPSNLAIDSANRFGITLIGFLRSEHFNVYTHPVRIKK